MRARSGDHRRSAVTVVPSGASRRLPPASRWSAALLALLPLPLVLHASALPDRAVLLALDALYVPLCLAGLLLALRAAAVPGTPAPRVWRWVAVAFGCRLFGEVCWLVQEAWLGSVPQPSVADVGYVAFYPVLLLALLAVPTPGRRRADRAVLALDSVTVAAGACVVLWPLLLSDLLQTGLGDRGALLNLAYALGDLLLVLGGARAAVSGTVRGTRVPVSLAVAGLCAMVVGDVAFGRDLLASGPDRAGPLVDLGWTAALVLLAVAADVARRTPVGTGGPDPARPASASELPPAPSLLPYAAALVTLALVGRTAAALPLHPHGGLLAAAILVVLAAVLRQVLVSREHARLVRLYEEAAIEDALTGALTRRRLLELGGRLSARGRAAVFVIDVDHFKSVNDTHGHLAGDAVLAEVGRRCLAALRPGDLLGRYGGDELVAVLPGADAATARRCAERLHAAAVGAPVVCSTAEIPVSLSVGVAASTVPSELTALIDRADTALYAAKATGRGRVVSAEDADGQRLPPPPAPGPLPPAPLGPDDLARAVAEHRLAVHYQPRVDLRTGRLTCCEAFVRWQHPERGLLHAGTFLPELQDRTSLALVTDRVLSLTLADCATWRAAHPDLRLAVNLPGVLLTDPWLPTRLLASVAAAGLPPDALELEITEEALGDDEVAGRVVAALRSEGLRVAVDDFGTGATSLTTLRHHVLDVLKLHPSLLATRLADPRDLAVIRALAALGHELGLTVVAEGVEDPVSRDLLGSLGVDEVQGHLVSRPVPLAALLPLVASHRPASPSRPSRGPLTPVGGSRSGPLTPVLDD